MASGLRCLCRDVCLGSGAGRGLSSKVSGLLCLGEGVGCILSGLWGGLSSQVGGISATVSGELLGLWCLGHGVDSALWFGFWSGRVDGVRATVSVL